MFVMRKRGPNNSDEQLRNLWHELNFFSKVGKFDDQPCWRSISYITVNTAPFTIELYYVNEMNKWYKIYGRK